MLTVMFGGRLIGGKCCGHDEQGADGGPVAGCAGRAQGFFDCLLKAHGLAFDPGSEEAAFDLECHGWFLHIRVTESIPGWRRTPVLP